MRRKLTPRMCGRSEGCDADRRSDPGPTNNGDPTVQCGSRIRLAIWAMQYTHGEALRLVKTRLVRKCTSRPSDEPVAHWSVDIVGRTFDKEIDWPGGTCEMRRFQSLRSTMANAVGAIAIVSFCGFGAQACEMSVAGKALWVRGRIDAGDQLKFHDLIHGAGAGRVSAVYLDSPGGDIYSAGEIARQIRTAGLSTVVDASQHVCASSCTIIFVGGVRRVYLNADRVGGLSDGRGFKGLGFHEGALTGQYGVDSYSGAATALMISLYQELGVPSAADLVDRASPDAIYGLSGAMALRLGIATSR